MAITIIPFEAGERGLDWIELCDAFAAGHRLPRAEISDSFLYRGADTLLSRAAWIDGLGLAVKSATVMPDNPTNGTPMINGAVSVFSDQNGTLEAVIDFHLVTKWKTAGDSLYAARKLARPDSRNILIIGAGTVAQSLHAAYSAGFADARFSIWNRTYDKAAKLAQSLPNTQAVTDLKAAVEAADIITSATMTSEPILMGDWLRQGQHVDLIGAYRPDMREADDRALTRADIFVDSRATTLNHIGELKIPLKKRVITPADVLADFYEPERFQRHSDTQITLFKNGGGAHLDLMTSWYILNAWKAQI